MANTTELHIRSILRNKFYPEHGKRIMAAYPDEYPTDAALFEHLAGQKSVDDTETNRAGIKYLARLHSVTLTWIENS